MGESMQFAYWRDYSFAGSCLGLQCLRMQLNSKSYSLRVLSTKLKRSKAAGEGNGVFESTTNGEFVFVLRVLEH